jgi:hypothetical protein
MTSSGAPMSIHGNPMELQQNQKHGQILQQNSQLQDQYPSQQQQIDPPSATIHTFLRMFSQKWISTHPSQHTLFGSVFHTYFYPPSGDQNATAGQAIMTKSMTNALDGKTWKMHKWQNKMNLEKKHRKVTMALLNFKTDHMVETITTNDPTPHTVLTNTRTSIQEMIAANHPREIAPTPTRAAPAAQVITTEMV